VSQIRLVLETCSLKMRSQARLDRGGQHGDAILVAFSAADNDLVGREVDVFDAEPCAFQQPEASAVQQNGHPPRGAVKPLDDSADFLAGQDDRKALRALGSHDIVEPWQVDLEDVSIQKQESAERLVLGGRGDVLLDGQPVEELCDLGGTHLGWMALVVEQDVTAASVASS